MAITKYFSIDSAFLLDSRNLNPQILVFCGGGCGVLGIFECGARLMVCEHSKIPKSTQNAPKDEFFYFRAIFSITALNALLGHIMPLHFSSSSL